MRKSWYWWGSPGGLGPCILGTVGLKCAVCRDGPYQVVVGGRRQHRPRIDQRLEKTLEELPELDDALRRCEPHGRENAVLLEMGGDQPQSLQRRELIGGGLLAT